MDKYLTLILILKFRCTLGHDKEVRNVTALIKVFKSMYFVLLYFLASVGRAGCESRDVMSNESKTF